MYQPLNHWLTIFCSKFCPRITTYLLLLPRHKIGTELPKYCSVLCVKIQNSVLFFCSVKSAQNSKRGTLVIQCYSHTYTNGNLWCILFVTGTGERHTQNMLENDMQRHSFSESRLLLFVSVYWANSRCLTSAFTYIMQRNYARIQQFSASISQWVNGWVRQSILVSYA